MKYNIFMRKAWTLLISGIWLTSLPYLGFPYSWKDVLTSFSGIVLIIISFLIYKDYKTKETKISLEKTYDNFRENKYFDENKNGNRKDSSPEQYSEM
jgi:amino acid permease